LVSRTCKTNTWTPWKNIPFFGLAKMKLFIKKISTSPPCGLGIFLIQKWKKIKLLLVVWRSSFELAKMEIFNFVFKEFIWTCKNGNFLILFLRSPSFGLGNFFNKKWKKNHFQGVHFLVLITYKMKKWPP
jgi:hypothetical protein